MATLEQAKRRLDRVMGLGRVHWYKPIQIAEILHHHRQNPTFDLRQLETYRAPSRRWRDQIARRLVGRACTSSARFQDNLFEQNAVPPEYIALLAEANEKTDSPGVVEAHIYASFAINLDIITNITRYLLSATTDSFVFQELLDHFQSTPGLRRSVDKAYEIVVYALFDTLVNHLEATVTVSVADSKKALLREFEDFTRIVLGVSAETPEITKLASLHRVGATHAADRGLDMWANFGPAIQVKHVSLSRDEAAGIVGEVAENAKVVIVCATADQAIIETVLTQVGLSHRVQGVVTMADLERWYSKCLGARFADTLGEDLLKNLRTQFELEFPSTGSTFMNFQAERGYDRIKLSGLWQLSQPA